MGLVAIYDIFLSINTTFDICLFFFSVVLDNLANLSVDEDKNKQPAEVQRNTSDEKEVIKSFSVKKFFKKLKYPCLSYSFEYFSF